MAKTRIDIIAGEEAYKNLAQFEEIEDLNKTVRIYKDRINNSNNRKDVKTNLVNLLEVLKRHSCKQLGVSYMCKNTIAEKLGVSYKTIQRLMSKLESLGMIQQIPMKRKSDMQQTANAVVIIPFIVEDEEKTGKTPAEKAEKCPTKKTNSISLKQNIKNINKRNSNTETNAESVSPSTIEIEEDKLDHTFVSSNIPFEFIETVRPFFNKAVQIEKMWAKAKLAAKKANIDVHENLESIIKTFKETVRNIKRGWNKKDVYGYVYGAFHNTTSLIARRSNSFDNWLMAD